MSITDISAIIMSKRILLSGSSGGLGSRVLYHLKHTLLAPPSSLVISTPRDHYESPEGVEVRHGDFLKPATLPSAFADAGVFLLVSYPSIAHAIRVEAHKNAIDASVRAGTQHIVYTSLAFAGDSKASVMQAHIDTEEYLRHTCARSGIRYTILREGIYSESYPLYLGFFDAKTQQESSKREVLVPATQNEGIAWVSRDELGEGTARILCNVFENLDRPDGGPYADKTILLSGPRAVSLKDVGGAVNKVLGWEGDEELRVREVPEDEFVKCHAANREGSMEAEDFIRAWATSFPAIAKGELAVVDPSLQQILGRKPKDFHEVLPVLLQDITGAKGSITQYAN